MKFYIIAISTAMLLSGCMTHSTLKKRTASVIGCHPQDITIENRSTAFSGGEYYTATCNEQSFSCTAHEDFPTQTRCAPVR
ncbi:hypothetical protein Hc94105_1671 [Helicobacter cinaedi]|uniref:hypothetical protein n=1 Tax=Helicobacter cinaedi TaxID=213 RepID=UPI001F2AEBDE|nr:hypothetical protein [Helicobacter cinaedi]BDB67448.1 hypothetical protein Hc94105_1671 [Helicobacter cinaedi]